MGRNFPFTEGTQLLRRASFSVWPFYGTPLLRNVRAFSTEPHYPIRITQLPIAQRLRFQSPQDYAQGYALVCIYNVGRSPGNVSWWNQNVCNSILVLCSVIINRLAKGGLTTKRRNAISTSPFRSLLFPKATFRQKKKCALCIASKMHFSP